MVQIKFFRSLQVTSDKKPPSLLPASLPAPAAAPAAAVAPKGITQRDERSFFEIAATVKQTAALQQQKEQQLATDQAKLQQAKAEQAERRAEEAAMKRPPGRPKKDYSVTGQLGCGDTKRAQRHS